jgi:hypothetical protein
VASYKLWSCHTIAICIWSATSPSASTQRSARLILWSGTMAVCYGAWISLYRGVTQGHLFEFCCFPCRNLLRRIENFQKSILWNTTSYAFHHCLSILLRDRSQSSISMTYPRGLWLYFQVWDHCGRNRAHAELLIFRSILTKIEIIWKNKSELTI